AEGVIRNMEPNGCIEDNPEDFAKKALQFYQDETFWTEQQQNGFQIINKRFNKKALQKKLVKKIQETTQHLNKKRLNNFIGQMLQHHTMQSTKFMAKWIEEKNK